MRKRYASHLYLILFTAKWMIASRHDRQCYIIQANATSLNIILLLTWILVESVSTRFFPVEETIGFFFDVTNK